MRLRFRFNIFCIFFCLLGSLSSSFFSQEIKPICPKLTVFFTNGIKNEEKEALGNLNELKASILQDHFNNDIHTKVGNYRYTDLKFRLNYNQTEWGPNDFLEVFNFDDFSDEYDQGLPGYLDKHHNALPALLEA